MTKDNTSIIATAAANASAAAHSAAEAAAKAADNAVIAAKAAAESAIVINGVATDTSWVKKSLERVENTLNDMSKAFVTSAQHAEVIKQLDDHELRLNSIETEKTKLTVLVVVTGSLITFLVGLLIWHLFQQGV